MTRWKDRLPEYEPGKGSWERLEKSLYLEEQLRRELPNLPLREPGENTWDEIASRLPGRDRAFKPAPVRRLRLYYGAAAAAVLIIALPAFFLLTQRGALWNDQPGRQTASQKAVPGPDTAGGKTARPADPTEQTAPVQRAPLAQQPPVQQTAPAQPPASERNVAGVAGGTKQAEKTSGSIYKTPRAADHGLVEVRRTKLAKNAGLKPAETSPIISGRTGLPEDSIRLIAGADPKQNAAPKQNTGHHRVIQVQWKEPKKSSLNIAKLPAVASDTDQESASHLIQIKL